MSFKYLPVAWALIYGKKDGIQCNQHGTRKYCVFNHSSVVFSGKNHNIITQAEGATLRFWRCVLFLLFLFLSVSHLNRQAWLHVKAICIDGRVVSTSDSESVGPGSIPGGRISNFFSFFLFSS